VTAFTRPAFSDPLINGLGGEAGFGEGVLVSNDDSSSAAIDITSVFPDGLNFYGTTYNQIYANNNGNVTLNGPLGTFTPFAITGITANPLFAPFFADVDTRGGAVTPTPGGNSRGTNLVYWDLDPERGIVTVTWDDVGYYSARTDKLNAFQLRLIKRGGSGFDIEFRWEAVNWTTGNASGGSGGLGGTVARAGWSAGNGENFIEMPQSGDQEQMLALDSDPGIATFQVRNGVVCSISPNPSSVDFGGAPLDRSVSRTIRLTNNETQAATIESISIVNEDGSPATGGVYAIVNDNATGTVLETGASTTFDVQFTPAEAGEFLRALNIAVDCSGVAASIGIELAGKGGVPVTFVDATLEDCIRQALGIEDGEVLDAEMETLTNLDLSGKGITDLTGLQAASNLRILDVRGNNFQDIPATFAILDQLPLYCLYRDFSRTTGSNPGNLTEVEVSGPDGSPIFVVVDTNELETLDVSTGVIDVTEPANLVILSTLQEQGVQIETGPGNLPPAASIVIDGSLTDEDGDGMATVTLNGSGSGDIDGTVIDWAWSWGGQTASGETTTATFSTAPTTVTLTVTDDDGATDTATHIVVLAQLVTFADTEMEAAIREALDMPTGPIDSADMATLTSFQSYFGSIADLTGLEFAVNLETLDLFGNSVSDISQVAALTNLKRLSFGENQVVDVSALAGLPNLEWLSLNNNEITNLDGIENLPSLEELYLTGNGAQLKSIASLLALPNLQRLDLLGTPLDWRPGSDVFATLMALEGQGCECAFNRPGRLWVELIESQTGVSFQFGPFFDDDQIEIEWTRDLNDPDSWRPQSADSMTAGDHDGQMQVDIPEPVESGIFVRSRRTSGS